MRSRVLGLIPVRPMKCFAELFELTHCWEGDEPLHQKPGSWAEAFGFLDQHVQPDLQENHMPLMQTVTDNDAHTDCFELIGFVRVP